MTRVKICGITNIEDARVAADAGADLLGFIFYAKSPRYITPEQARKIVQPIRHSPRATRFVGVFVNESLERIRATIEIAQLDFAQLHGDESVELVRALSPCVYKALRPRDVESAHAQIETYRDAVQGNTPAFLVDAFDENQFGGTGIRADWDLVGNLARDFPLLLAGGLTPENVADAIRHVQPWGVDVSSGIERAPGMKDYFKVQQFIRAAKS